MEEINRMKESADAELKKQLQSVDNNFNKLKAAVEKKKQIYEEKAK